MQPPRLERLVRRAAGKRAFLLFAHPVFMFSLSVLVERLHRVRTYDERDDDDWETLSFISICLLENVRQIPLLRL